MPNHVPKEKLGLTTRHIAHSLRIAMAIKDMSQTKLAKRSGYSEHSLSRLLGDRTSSSDPKLSTIYCLAEALDLTMDELWSLPHKARGLLNTEARLTQNSMK